MLLAAWEAVIGLECHAQLRTASKMFCACPVVQDAAPNSAVCEVCLGHPGTLPALNAEAVALALRAAVALGCEVHATSVFARKNYFYPDLPKGYQISQYDRPLATKGTLHAAGRAFGLTRIHLEEDAGKMVHGPGGTVVDWNRAGVPLVEIVGEPELRTPEEAEAWLRTLHRLLVRSGVCLGDMEKGHFRCDANVSVHRAGEPWGTRVEIKNVNSFRFVAKAIRYEIDRQIAAYEAGEPVWQETRTWAGNRTVTLRRKEGSADYRYFPEPDLPPLRVGAEEIAAQVAALPGVPLDVWLAEADAARVADWQARYGLSTYDVGVVTADGEVADFFAAAVEAGGEPKAMANWVAAEVLRRTNADGIGRLQPAHLVAVQRLLDAGAINRDGARRLFDALADAGGDPDAHVATLGLRQVSDEGALRAIVDDLLARHPAELARYRAGNKGMMGFFMGQLMAATDRQADPKLAQRLVREALDSAR
ncbi:MAG: Asp-tRNA(Asn)/Glu-tRNA(Gln) amidotransferase subunit GatB [Myxococcota bacterium]